MREGGRRETEREKERGRETFIDVFLYWVRLHLEFESAIQGCQAWVREHAKHRESLQCGEFSSAKSPASMSMKTQHSTAYHSIYCAVLATKMKGQSEAEG